MLGRLRGAFSREPVPGVTGWRHEADTVVITLENGTRLTAPSSVADRFATVPEDFTIFLTRREGLR
ncbi:MULTISPECIES: hypothetical protein [unclassified Streptomyces]|uniref:hypothetical protein n=1 Tax=unclassified Streptomyces TaxID=2593676 RepID=UPI00168B0411|nr:MULTISPECIES: hypothetical protein [unclassified Streptomyces]MBD3007956.1 hypothetical protein [Streptomyces sp. 5-10]